VRCGNKGLEKTVERETSRILFLSKFEPVDEVKRKEVSGT
jgi:hypothetical protein